MDENKEIELSEREKFYRMEAERLGLDIEVQEPKLDEVSVLGAGSIGQVNVAYDRVLGRAVAVKSLHDHLAMRSDQLERMVREAQAAAQLEHPNIVPIYSLGISPEHGVYFTMKRLKGDSLRHIISELAHKNPAYTWVYTWQRRLSIFMRICQGMAYAHSKGVLHRDLKPENVRIGNFGEVTIIDWGLVREVHKSNESNLHKENLSQTAQNIIMQPKLETMLDTSNPTMDGEFSGTPRYMSPEQASGQVTNLDARSDVYALGVILYELMTCCNPFHAQEGEDEILNAVRHGKYNRPRDYVTAANLPAEMEAICLKALNLNPDKRYQTVVELLADIYAHQEGREVQAYHGNIATSARRCFQRNPLRSVAFMSILLTLIAFQCVLYVFDMRRYREFVNMAKSNYSIAEHAKTVAGEKSREAGATRITAEKLSSYFTDVDVHYENALFYLNSVPHRLKNRAEIISMQEDILAQRLLFNVEFRRRPELMKALENLNRRYMGDYTRCGDRLHDAMLRAHNFAFGDNYISQITSNVPKTTMSIYPLEADEKTGIMRVMPEYYFGDRSDNDGNLGAELPLNSVNLPNGEYRLVFRAEGHQSVKFHIIISDYASGNIAVTLPKHIPDRMCYIPEGKACVGGPTLEENGTVVEIGPFFIGKYEVTFREYFDFWKQLPQKQQDALLPRIYLTSYDEPIPAWNNEGEPAECVGWDNPVVGISAAAAEEYCRWYGRKVGRNCRLPTSDEWEKAARGVNGRLYPWGNSYVAGAAFLKDNMPAQLKYGPWAPVGSFPEDCSVYGVMDTAGNVREWTSSMFNDGMGMRIIKGASASTSTRYLPLGKSHDSVQYPSDVGFRIVQLLNQDDI